MKIRSWRWVALVAAAISVLGASVGFAQKAPSPQPQAERDPAPGQVTPLAVDTFDGRVEPVDGTDGRRHLAYELRLTNITVADLTIERVRVLDPSRGGRMVDELSGNKLASRIVVFGAPDKRFGPGVSGFLFMDVTYATGARLPERLEYRLDGAARKATGLTNSFRVGPTRVSGEEPAQIGSPLFGKRWLTGEGCCDALTSHRARTVRHRLGAGR